ncbi:MAG: RNA pseudouridine synthase [Bradymonadaceae bacterium]|nr:RNA pseudouridine synthase [Lujinxingiaceae bacterium]
MLEFSTRILYEHDGVIAWDKPAGLAATGRTLEDPDCAQYLAMQHYRRMIWAVHQLDAETSGVLVFVRKKSLVPIWQQRLGASKTAKRYLAIVHGRLDHRQRVIKEPVGGKAARSDFRVLSESAQASLLEVRIHTGRTHQIRIHLEHLGLTLFGEKRYGAAPCEEHPRHALHAASIEFGDGEEPQKLEAPLAEDMVELAARLGLSLQP